VAEEVFAPVVSVMPFTSLDEAIDEVNSTPFGLAAGLFTRDVTRAMTASRRLHVGIVHINEPSSSRVDLMPFAGVKDSGLGREGPEVRDAGNDRRTSDHDQSRVGVLPI
jgi:succinate-semialdehyde dehydrogenase/glutarate-semialdehyde dehydrogenase